MALVPVGAHDWKHLVTASHRFKDDWYRQPSVKGIAGERKTKLGSSSSGGKITRWIRYTVWNHPINTTYSLRGPCDHMVRSSI